MYNNTDIYIYIYIIYIYVIICTHYIIIYISFYRWTPRTCSPEHNLGFEHLEHMFFVSNTRSHVAGDLEEPAGLFRFDYFHCFV